MRPEEWRCVRRHPLVGKGATGTSHQMFLPVAPKVGQKIYSAKTHLGWLVSFFHENNTG